MRCSRWVMPSPIFVMLVVAAWIATARAVSNVNYTYVEPVVLRSEGGVLEVRLRIHQGLARLNTVVEPVSNFMLHDYELIQGVASDGRRAGRDLYPGPTLNVYPGERLVIHYANALEGLTIADLYDPAWTPVGEVAPPYPPPLKSSPINNHVHGIHTSPSGNSDNVLLSIPPGFTNTYSYEISTAHPWGLYWYHPHRHMMTSFHVSRGIAGMLVIGRADGGVPLATQIGMTIRTMALQLNWVPARAQGMAQMGNVYWSSALNTSVVPTTEQLLQGTYEPKLAPVNFAGTPPGTKYVTNWWAGSLAPDNNRGRYQFIPQDLLNFESADRKIKIRAKPRASPEIRDVQFTVNGAFMPRVPMRRGETQIWVLGGFCDACYFMVRFTETATGTHPKIPILGQDGNPYDRVQYSELSGGTTILIPPATRYVVAVTMPERGDLVLEMPPLPESTRAQTLQGYLNGLGVLYTSNGTPDYPGVLGTVSVDAESVSYADGFFVYPTQVLARAVVAPGRGRTVEFKRGQKTGAYTSFYNTVGQPVAVDRELVITGGFGNEWASLQSPLAFAYQFDNNQFPNVPLVQPRLSTIEKWSFINLNNDQHPIHVHINDFQVVEIVDPTLGPEGTVTGPRMWGQDNINTPVPKVSSKPPNKVIHPGAVRIATYFQQYLGTFVFHCHRLNHEDGGLMALVNIIPQRSLWVRGEPGKPATTVIVYDSETLERLNVVVPFAAYSGPVSLAVADVDGDAIFDVIVGSGPGLRPARVVVFSGASNFESRIMDFAAFPRTLAFDGGIFVAAGVIAGNNATRANIVVGTGPSGVSGGKKKKKKRGLASRIVVFESVMPPLGQVPEVYAEFVPFEGWHGGVSVAVGSPQSNLGRSAIVVGPLKGMVSTIKTFVFTLFTPNTPITRSENGATESVGETTNPILMSSFVAFGPRYKGGVSLATGWVAGTEGGLNRIIVSQLTGARVKVYSTGSRLQGHPKDYIMPVTDYSAGDPYTAMADFVWVDNRPEQAHNLTLVGGLTVAASSTARGAWLVVAGTFEKLAEYERPGPPHSYSMVFRTDLGRSSPDAVLVEPLGLSTRLLWSAQMESARMVTIGGG